MQILDINGLTHFMSVVKNALSKKVNESELIDKIYPIGSVYISTSSADPSTIFGGTWEQMKDAFLLGAGDIYAAGSTGGEATHTLTVDEMPTHNHHFELPDDASAQPNVPTWPEATNPATSDDYWHVTWEAETSLPSGFFPYTNWIRDISDTGGSQPHNNMPPYIAVFVWKRIS